MSTQFGESLVKVRELAGIGDIDGLVRELESPAEVDSGRVSVRGAAALRLGMLRADQATKPLIQMLRSDPNEHVRSLVAQALRDIGNREAVGPLIAALDDHGK